MVPIDSEPLPLRIADASVLDTSTDYVHSPGTKAVPHVSTAMMPLPPAVGDTTSIHRISDHVDLRRLSNGNISLDIGGHTGAESIDNRSDANVQTNAIDAGRLSLAVGSDAIDMGEYATLEDHVRRGSLGGPNKRPRQRVAKDSISSAMLLNSWYISYVNKGDKKRARRAAVEDAVVSDDRPRRYPTRNRLPPIQHWNSNFHEDGSSVLFLVGVTSSDDTKLNQSLAPSDLLSDDGNSPVGSPVASRMQPRKIPDASLVLSDSGGTMDVHLVESSAERYLPITNHVSGREDIAILPLNSRGERTREPRSDIDLRAIEDVRTGKSIPKSVRKPAKRVEGTRKSTAGRKKERREMTVGEAWDILLTEDHVTSDDISEIQERPKVAKRGRPKASTVSTASLTMTEKGPTQSASQPRGNLEPDSEAFDRGRLFSYNSLFRIDRAPIHAHHGSLFQPLVMNKRCRTSHVVIPKGKNVQMGNVKGNFITGYLYTGDRVCIRSLGTHWPVEPGRAFFLPIYEEWALYNESDTHDAVLALIFVTIQ
ncbi:hypothetical protein BBOV_II003320 [Babesia bovis T2Bo]|uniref:hypothetical protein n=1 Tax=Babesia bovis T2Bo TaxID=484906 RepID=UPI001C36C2C1|nr:hypothetical protein BBOV_II003320 [Babesia bovis T2Bo]EDO06287.2 hypothetical protein BBOV_II003320 [Babesia bovis T2Bo]